MARLNDLMYLLTMESTEGTGKNDEKNNPPEILTVDKLNKLRWMSVGQLESIYGHGRRNVQLEDNPDVYRKLYWFSEDQLQAIFGGKNP